MMLEVCVDSLESAINAIHGCADELEVCSSLPEGGLTPSVGLVKQIICLLDNISNGQPLYKTCNDCNCKNLIKIPKVNIMIRCRAGADFCYSEQEIDTMVSDLENFATLRVDRFVFGALTTNQEVDKEKCQRIIKKAYPLPVTFHRAFDICKEPVDAVKVIIELGFNRLLTSGKCVSVAEDSAIDLIKGLIENFGSKIQIMPGAGVNRNNVPVLIQIGCRIIHCSCKIRKELSFHICNDLGMGRGDIYVTDESIVREIKRTFTTTYNAHVCQTLAEKMKLTTFD